MAIDYLHSVLECVAFYLMEPNRVLLSVNDLSEQVRQFLTGNRHYSGREADEVSEAA